MKKVHFLSILAATGVLLAAGLPSLLTSETDTQIESSFSQSYLAQKERTAEYAGDVEGVKGIKNEMTFAATPNPPADLEREEIDDASITAQVKSSLGAHYSTSALQAKIVTTDGVVTVGGNAANATQITRVTKLIEDINGVTGVINNMTIEVLESQAQARPSPVRNLRVRVVTQ